jgi:hypothetical protein
MPAKQPPQPQGQRALLAFALAAGLFFFLVIIKFGDPVIMDYNSKAPPSVTDGIFESWPSRWGPWLMLPLVAVGLLTSPWKRLQGGWLVVAPALWLVWELLASSRTVSSTLTSVTLEHFFFAVALFYLGRFALNRASPTWPIWTGMGLALCWIIRAGFEQHFGGLEATRKMIVSGQLIPDLPPEVLRDPEFLRRIARDRIFSTFWNANALAGALLLLLPLSLVFLWRLTPKVRLSIRVGFVVILGGCGLACLYWTGSKAGWLVAMVTGLLALYHGPLPLKWKRCLIGGLLIAGAVGFGVKYASFFQKERNSVGARFAYWRAARTITMAHPLFGTGPGTFQIPFQRIKQPDDEMSRLVHNDYLEQGSDSGIMGLILYTGMIISFFYHLYRYSLRETPLNWLHFAVLLGLIGVCLQSLVDCHLYVPALAWPMFFLFGWMLSL